jgi:hypothetical protein
MFHIYLLIRTTSNPLKIIAHRSITLEVVSEETNWSLDIEHSSYLPIVMLQRYQP